MKPMLDPKRDLKGATHEKLARALLRPLGPRTPRARRKAVVGREGAVEQAAPDELGYGIPHLRKRP